jgi:hypothetical protein
VKSNRRIAAETAILTLLVLVLAACGEDAGADGSTTLTPPSAASPSQSQTPATSPVAEDLTFTGALSGRMTSGGAGDAFVCMGGAGAFVAGPILGMVDGQQVELNIAMQTFHGAGVYPPDGVSFDESYDHYYPATGSSGSLTVAADLKSGSLDVALAANSNPDRVVARVTGSWRCPAGGS